MNESSIIKPVLKLILAFIIMGSMAACASANSSDSTSAPISQTISSSSPIPTVEPKPESSLAQAAADNKTPKESAAKDDTIKASTQPAPSAAAVPSPTQESASEAHSLPSATPLAASPKGVTLSITGDDKHGVILSSTIVEIEGEVSVMTLLQKETRKEKIQMESSGKGIFAYVKGIANLYEFDRGAKSGWLFKVNGVFADKGAGSYKVKAGDQVEWLYTLDLGKDVGDKR